MVSNIDVIEKEESIDFSRVNVDAFVNESFFNALRAQKETFARSGSLYDSFLAKVLAVDELENLCFGLEYISEDFGSDYLQAVDDFKRTLNAEEDERIRDYKIASFKMKKIAAAVRFHSGLDFEGKL